MTPVDLEAIEARCSAATPGPWEWLDHDDDDGKPCACAIKAWRDDHPGEEPSEDNPIYSCLGAHDVLMSSQFGTVGRTQDASGYASSLVMDDDDRAFIAAARTDIPDLVREVRALRAALALADAVVAQLRTEEACGYGIGAELRRRLEQYEKAATQASQEMP